MATRQALSPRWHYLRDFLLGLAALSVFACVVTAGIVYFRAGGPDLLVAQDPWWGLAKWYVLDIHVTLGLTALGAGLLYLLLRAAAGAGGSAVSVRMRGIAAAAGIVAGLLLIRWVVNQHGVFIEVVRATDYPSSRVPDQIVLTWSDDPRYTQTVQWRTRLGEAPGSVRHRPAQDDGWVETPAETATLFSHNLAHDFEILRHTARITGLAPDTEYVYQVGHAEGWTAERRFRTAPAGPAPFSFLYVADSQEGLLDYGEMIEAAAARHPDARFIIHGGDIVNRGCDRDDWDLLFHASRNVNDQLPLVPTIGNHDVCGPSDVTYYLGYFALPDNGSDALTAGQTYSLTYGDAFFAVPNSNYAIAEQAPWLDAALGASEATWKFTLWHHPAYVSRRARDNPEVRAHWVPLVDKHGVRIVFQGHDHAYMRTKPMRGNEIVDSPDEGAIYLISVAGTKFYDAIDRDYMDVIFERVMTYSLIEIDGNHLRYRAFDLEGNEVDAFELTSR